MGECDENVPSLNGVTTITKTVKLVNFIVIGFCVFELQLQPHDHIRSLPIVISSG